MTSGVGTHSASVEAPAARRTSRHASSWTRAAWAILLALLCTAVLALRVHGGFERARLPAIAAPEMPDGSSFEAILPNLDTLAGNPAALIIRARGTDAPATLRVAIGPEILTIVPLPAAEVTRIDATFVPKAGAEYRLTLTADRPGWQAESIEVSNAHGFSRGLLSFVVVPRSRPHEPPFPRWLFVPILAGLLALRPSFDWPGRIRRAVHGAIAVLVCLLFAAVLLAPVLSPYTVLLAPWTFVLCVAGVYPHAVRRLLVVATPDAARHSRAGLAARRFLPHLVLTMLFLGGVAQFHQPGLGFTRLIAFGEEFGTQALPAVRALPHAIESEWGYDGQFYAQMALDPLLRGDEIAAALDAPGFRGRRVLFSWTAGIAGAGDPWRVLQAYALQNVVFWLLLGVVLLRWLPPDQPRMVASWAGCMLACGMFQSVRLALLDGPSMLLLAAGIVAVEKNRPWTAAAILGVSGLGKETNVLGAGILAEARRPSLRETLRLAGMGVAVIAPLLLWLAYLSSLEFAGGAGARAFALPFTGYIESWASVLLNLRTDGWESDARYGLLTLVSLTVQAAVLLWRRDWQNPWWRLGMGSLVLMPLLGDAVWEGYPGAVTRVLLPMTFAFNVLLPRGRWFWPLWVAGNVSAVYGFRALEIPLLGGLENLV